MRSTDTSAGILWLAFAITYLAMLPSLFATDPIAPIVSKQLVFEEVNGLVAVEAEHFASQTGVGIFGRTWYLTTADTVPLVKPDGDASHVAGASGGAYLEVLPDTRRMRDDPLVEGENTLSVPGLTAVVSYKVHFNTPGRYYVWARAYSTGTEDNSLHVGIDGTWPESGQRMQWSTTNQWYWDSKQWTNESPTGVPGKLFLDVKKAGIHIISFSVRDDGFELDKWLMTTDAQFARPKSNGPPTRIKSGEAPKPFRTIEPKPRPKTKIDDSQIPKQFRGSHPHA